MRTHTQRTIGSTPEHKVPWAVKSLPFWGPFHSAPSGKCAEGFPLHDLTHCSLLNVHGGPQVNEDDCIEFSLILYSFQGMFLRESSSIHTCDPHLSRSNLDDFGWRNAYHCQPCTMTFTKRGHGGAGVPCPPWGSLHRQETQRETSNPSKASWPG